MPERRPKISVIIPVFNRSDLLERAVASVQEQTLHDLEIIICDDCSTDQIREVVKALQRSDARVRYVKTSVNGGPSVARDLGCRAARAPYLVTLDSDDVYLSPRKLEKELALAESVSKTGRPVIGYSVHVILDKNLTPLSRQPQFKKPQAEGDLLFSLLTRSILIPRDFVFSKELYEKVGGYDAAVAIYEDWDLKLRLAKVADFILTDVKGTGYCRGTTGISKTSGRAEHQAWQNYVFCKNLPLLAEERHAEARQKFADYLKKNGLQPRPLTMPNLSERERLGEGLAFLFSLPRSGSTLTQRLLANHKSIHTFSEPWLMLAPLCANKTDGITAHFNQFIAADALQRFISELPGTEESYRYWLRTCYGGLYRNIRESNNAEIFLDKTPRYHLIAKDLIDLFPRAKFILLWRHPLAILSSIFETVRFDINALKGWGIDISCGFENLLAIRETGKAIEVTYEDIVLEPEKQLRRLCEYLGQPFEATTLELANIHCPDNWRYGDKKRAWRTRFPDRESLDLWKARIGEHRAFAELADSFLVAKEGVLRNLPYEYSEMRALVPRLNSAQSEQIIAEIGRSFSGSIANNNNAPNRKKKKKSRLRKRWKKVIKAMELPRIDLRGGIGPVLAARFRRRNSREVPR